MLFGCFEGVAAHVLHQHVQQDYFPRGLALKGRVVDLLQERVTLSSKLVGQGDVIFDEGETINGVYCVKDGICKLSKLWFSTLLTHYRFVMST